MFLCSLSPDEFAYCAWYVVDRFPLVDSYVVGPLMPVHEMICGEQKHRTVLLTYLKFILSYTRAVSRPRSCKNDVRRTRRLKLGLVLLSTHADRQGVDMSFTVCVFLYVCLFVCVVTDFSAEDKHGMCG